MVTFAKENYLKAILTLSMCTDGKVSTNAIADELHTSAASVSDMLKKLKEEKLIKYQKYKGLELSKKGYNLAISIMRKHRLWETFLVEKLSFSWSEVHDIAEQLEHIKSNKLINKLDHYLNYPQFDPHGEPIPTQTGIFPKNNTIALDKLKIKDKGTIMGVTIDEKPFLNYLTKLKITIGSKIILLEKFDFDQSLNIKIDDAVLHISKDVAKYILIKKE